MRRPDEGTGCQKRGPYLPLGDVEWMCVTHGVECIRTGGDLRHSAKREDMACPVGEPERVSTTVVLSE